MPFAVCRLRRLGGMHLFELLFTEANQQMLAHQVGKQTHTGMKEEIIYSSMAANKADRI